jgi:hypothetical protein
MKTNDAAEPAPSPAPNDAGFAALSNMVIPSVETEEHDPDAPRSRDEAGGVASDAGEAEPPKQDRMTKQTFRLGFKGAFKIASVVPAIGVAELAVQPDEEEHANVAADATFDLLELYFPSFFDEEREVLGLLIAAGSFFIMKGMVVAAVIKARKEQELADMRARRQQVQDPQPEFKSRNAKPASPPPAAQPDFATVSIQEWEAA